MLTYRRWRQKAEYATSGVFWRDDENFDLAHHIRRVRLPGRGDKQALERFVGELASEPLDPNHPLWTVHIVEDYQGGAALVFRLHHAMADGMALMGVTMSLVDGPAHEGRRPEPAGEDDGWLRRPDRAGRLDGQRRDRGHGGDPRRRVGPARLTRCARRTICATAPASQGNSPISCP